MHLVLMMSLFAMLFPVRTRLAASSGHTGVGTTHRNVLHFRYFPQRTATFLEAAQGRKHRRVRLGSPTVQIAGDYSRDTVASPDGRVVYSCAGDTFYVAQYRVGQGGVVYPLKPFKIAAHSHPGDISLHPNGRFAYVSCSHGAICQYRINRNGSLAPLVPPEVYGSNDPSPLRFDSSGKFACVVADGPDDMTWKAYVYRVREDGVLMLVRALHFPYVDVRANRITIRL